MIRAPTEADLVRLRQFLKRVETDAQGAPGETDVDPRELAMLKDEIAYLETAGSKAFLLEIDIDYGTAQLFKRSPENHWR